MRLLPIVTSLSLAVIAMPMVSYGVLSQTTRTTNLSVTIIKNLKFCVSPGSAGGIYGSLSQVPSGIQDIGILSVCSNGPFGVEVDSANAGKMVSATSSYTIPYQVRASSTGGAGLGTDVIGRNLGQAYTTLFTPSSTTPIYSSKGGTNPIKGLDCPVSCDIKLQWQVKTTSPVPAGVYTDTLTYTLTAK